VAEVKRFTASLIEMKKNENVITPNLAVIVYKNNLNERIFDIK
jgi:hypothetical protein